MFNVDISNEDILFIQKCYLDELEFDLTDSQNKGHFFYDNFQYFLSLDIASEQAKYIFLNNLYGPIEYLNSIGNRDKKKYKDYKNRLIKNIKNLGIYGDIFEIYIAWTLIEKGIDFKITKPPLADFEIEHNKKSINIEATSCQFRYGKVPSVEDFSLKIRKTLIDKMGNPYAITTTALFVDITNLCFHSKRLNNVLTKEYLKNILVDATNASKTQNNFGLIAFFYFNSSKKITGEIGYSCNIFDVHQNAKADYNLVSFLKNNLITEISNEEEMEIMQYNH